MLFLQDQMILGLSPMDFSSLVGGFYFIACLSIGLIALDPGELVLMAPLVALLAFLIWPAVIVAMLVLVLCTAALLIGWAVKSIFASSKSPPLAE